MAKKKGGKGEKVKRSWCERDKKGKKRDLVWSEIENGEERDKTMKKNAWSEMMRNKREKENKPQILQRRKIFGG